MNSSADQSREEGGSPNHQGNISTHGQMFQQNPPNKLPDNPTYRHSGKGPRNMDELSDLIFGMREDIFALKDKKHRDYRKRYRSSSFSRSRSRARGRFRSSSRSSGSSRSRSRHRHSRDRSRRRSSRRRSYSRSRSRSTPRYRRHRSPHHSSRPHSRDRSPLVKKAKQVVCEHPISDSDDEGGKLSQRKLLENEPHDDPDNPFCGYVKQIASDTKTGDPVDSWVAQFVDKALSAPPAKDILADVCDKYKRPENVVNLQVPAVEPAVWLAISSKARTKDNLRQKHQETFVKMLTALTAAANELNNRYMKDQKSNNPQLEWLMEPLGQLKDAIVIGGFHNMQDIIKRRRYDLEYFMPEKYRRLCSDFTTFPPSPTALLGENIEDAVKQMDLTNKLSQKLDKNSKFNNNNNRSSQGNSSGQYYNKKGQNSKNHRNPKGNYHEGRQSSNYPSSSNQNQTSSRQHDKNRNKGGAGFRKGGPQK